MKTLKHPLVRVNEQSFGGNQAWFSTAFMKKVGCGVISAANLLIHLQKKEQMSEQEYIEFAKQIWLRYLPVIPGFGINGLTLMAGLNRYFGKHNLPYKAFWGISGRKMLSRIDQMLEQDLPVILSVGPNFPNVFGKKMLNFYSKRNDGRFQQAAKTRAHYVTVTGRDGIYLQISSWGKAYYIDIREYREYVRSCSSPLVSNIIYINQRKGIQ